VGLVLRERPWCLASYLALLATHRCAVLITPIQPDASMCEEVDRLRLIALVADSQDWERSGLVEAAGKAGTLGVELRASGDPDVVKVAGTEASVGDAHYQAEPDIVATLLTSGTTGMPKRIPLTVDAIAGSPPANPRGVGARGVSINAIPLVSIGGATGAVNAVWRGRPISLMDRFDPVRWAELVAEHRPRRLSAPPATLRMLLDRKVPRQYLRSGKVFIAGSAPVDLATSDAFEDAYGIPVVRTYGSTEFLGPVAAFAPEEYPLAQVKRGSVGRALPGTRIRIVDAETGAECPPGTIGVLEADPAKRALGQPEGWIRTRDLAHADADGFIWIDGRADDVLIRGGFKVHLSEVAEVLRQHPAIADASVVSLPDPRVNQVPGALVTLRPGADPPTEDELKEWVRKQKPPYYVPVEVRVVDELPRNAMLKTVPDRVRQLLNSSPAPDTSDP
jgi:acyl-coenzyme A synthetase/AMP-(fatty) acid ligase